LVEIPFLYKKLVSTKLSYDSSVLAVVRGFSRRLLIFRPRNPLRRKGFTYDSRFQAVFGAASEVLNRRFRPLQNQSRAIPGRMPPKRLRTAAERDLDRSRIAALRARGWTRTRIAQEMGIRPSLVSADIKAIHNDQARFFKRDAAQHLGMQVARMEVLLANALEGFEQSKTAAKVTQTRLPDGSIAERLEYHPGGDPKYLTCAKTVVESMNRILGLDNNPVLHQTNVTVDASHLLSQPMSVEDYMQATQSVPAPGPVVEATVAGTPDPVVSALMANLDSLDAADAAEEDQEADSLKDAW